MSERPWFRSWSVKRWRIRSRNYAGIGLCHYDEMLFSVELGWPGGFND